MYSFEKCETCNRVPEFLYANGYEFGDRLLEDVLFKIHIKDGDLVCSGVDKDSEAYFSKLSKRDWIAECLEFAKDTDFLTCPVCEEDIAVINTGE